MKKILLATAAILLGAGLAVAQQKQDFSKVEIKSTKIAGNPAYKAAGIWLLMGAGGNMAVSQGPDGKLLVDDEFKELAPRIKAAIAATGSGKLKWVVNTHYHGDHTGGNPVFGLDAPSSPRPTCAPCSSQAPRPPSTRPLPWRRRACPS